MKLNYLIGKFLGRLGYRIVRDYQWPEHTCNLVELGIAYLKLANPEKDLSIVQIGAFDGDLADPLKGILGNTRCKALLVEPQPEAMDKLKKRYDKNAQVTMFQAAIAGTDGTVTMHIPSTEPSPYASLSPEHHRRFGFKSSDIRTIEVPSVTADTLLKQHGLDEISVLQVDTEGYDLVIVEAFLETAVQPRIINFESFHLSREEKLRSRKVLEEKGYRIVESQFDTFAIKSTLANPAPNAQ